MEPRKLAGRCWELLGARHFREQEVGMKQKTHDPENRN
jgi:hypothetical protein